MPGHSKIICEKYYYLWRGWKITHLSARIALKGEELPLHPISPTDPRLTQKDRCMHSRVQQVQPETASPTGYPICYRLAVLTTSRGTWLKVCKQNPAPKLRQEGKSGLVTFSDKKQIEKMQCISTGLFVYHFNWIMYFIVTRSNKTKNKVQL